MRIGTWTASLEYWTSTALQPPPTLRGARVRGTKPRDVRAFHGCCVWCLGVGAGAGDAASDD
jgi:hypothetical protein